MRGQKSGRKVLQWLESVYSFKGLQYRDKNINKIINVKRAFLYKSLIVGLLSITYGFTQSKAQSTITREGMAYPIPPASAHRMFFLQRTPNANTIACDLNVDSKGNVNLKVPLTTYWLRYGDSPAGDKKELNFIQRHFAYGLNIKERGAKKYEFWFVSYKKYHMYLLQTKDGKWRVYGKINDKLTVLGSIFIYIKGGSFWNPHVEYVELRGEDLTTGKQEVQRLTDVKKDPDAGHDKEG
ncbi:DUF4833 domain-containing protein [Arachidicoccus terrestris]|uniref:DUF4833 domain-containing protein n=1 Tax=Arachidicoccus terrestris TaxID=2875539 RepID=UPI001CC3E75E|nr:DUF4833 domain-containing protein [Arachidicoccus terrestris]UAY55011.1 DUF4833 domain-containing protein [Arachidicoccus terrestris]